MSRLTGGSQWPSFRPSVANVFGIIRYDIFRQSLETEYTNIPFKSQHCQSYWIEIFAKQVLYQVTQLNDDPH